MSFRCSKTVSMIAVCTRKREELNTELYLLKTELYVAKDFEVPLTIEILTACESDITRNCLSCRKSGNKNSILPRKGQCFLS